MKKQKNIYEYINDAKFDISDYKEEKLDDLEKGIIKMNMKKSLKRKVSFKKIGLIAAAISLAVIGFGQTDIGQTVQATTQSKIMEIRYTIAKAIGTEKPLDKYTNVINTVKSNKGVDIKLDEVIIDKDELVLSSIVDTGGFSDGIHLDFDIYINGKNMEAAGSGSGRYDEEEKVFYEESRINISGIETKEDLDIEVKYNSLSKYNKDKEEKINGNWEFRFNANGKELAVETKKIDIDKSFDIEGNKYILEELVINKLNQKIYGKIENLNKDLNFMVDLKGHDNLGNKVEFHTMSIDNGKIILSYDKLSSEKELSEDIEYLNLTPYKTELPKKSGKIKDTPKKIGEEMTIKIK